MVEVENGFPINADVQLLFMDAQFNVLGSLFETQTNLINAGVVGPAPDYRVLAPTTKKSFIVVGKEKLDQLLNAEKLLFSAVLSTEDNQYVKVYSDYSLHLNMGAKVVYTY